MYDTCVLKDDSTSDCNNEIEILQVRPSVPIQKNGVSSFVIRFFTSFHFPFLLLLSSTLFYIIREKRLQIEESML